MGWFPRSTSSKTNKATGDSPCFSDTVLRNQRSLAQLYSTKATERFCRPTRLRGCGGGGGRGDVSGRVLVSLNLTAVN